MRTGEFNIIIAKENIGKSKMTKLSPKLIEEARLDGTKYIVFDPTLFIENNDGWVVASYKEDRWVPFVEDHIKTLHPTHFLEYYGWDVVS